MKNDVMDYGSETMTHRLRGALDLGKHKIADMGHRMAEKSKDVAGLTDECVHRNAWTAVLTSAALGLAIGLLIGRR